MLCVRAGLYMRAHSSGQSGKSVTVVDSLSCHCQWFRALQAAATRAEPAGNALRHLALHTYRFYLTIRSGKTGLSFCLLCRLLSCSLSATRATRSCRAFILSTTNPSCALSL